MASAEAKTSRYHFWATHTHAPLHDAYNFGVPIILLLLFVTVYPYDSRLCTRYYYHHRSIHARSRTRECDRDIIYYDYRRVVVRFELEDFIGSDFPRAIVFFRFHAA